MAIDSLLRASILTTDERKQLVEAERADIGRYRAWGPGGKDCNFIVELDARPLAVLIDEASLGERVYEFMSIARPGDIINYLYLTFIDIDEELVSYVYKAIQRPTQNSGVPETFAGMPFTLFDGCFYLQGDDTRPFAAQWIVHREQSYWNLKLDNLLLLVKKIQGRLQQTHDSLVQHEIHLMGMKKHRRDYWAKTYRTPSLEANPRQSTTPQPLFDLISELIKGDKVSSVSCPLTDYALWRVLVAEQVKRSQATGLPPQEAFCLGGPDSGLDFKAADWGGEIHIPYEGALDGDLFIKPAWHNFDLEAARKSGRLSAGFFGRKCHYLLTKEDYGDLECASRIVVGAWVLYESKATYIPHNPKRRR